MHEQVFLGGAPVVGFGAQDPDPYAAALARERAAAPATIIGFFVGAIGGAVLGNLVHKGATGAAVGAVTGGVGGAIGGNLLSHALNKTPLTMPWQRVPEINVSAGNGAFRQVLDVSNLKAGQQFALAIVDAGGAPIPPDQIAQFTALITGQFTAQIRSPSPPPVGNFVTYPPGAPLPADWPADDDLGPNAYRVMADIFADKPQDAAPSLPLASEGTVKMWTRSKP